jgi:hypothetical protein
MNSHAKEAFEHKKRIFRGVGVPYIVHTFSAAVQIPNFSILVALPNVNRESIPSVNTVFVDGQF